MNVTEFALATAALACALLWFSLARYRRLRRQPIAEPGTSPSPMSLSDASRVLIRGTERSDVTHDYECASIQAAGSFQEAAEDFARGATFNTMLTEPDWRLIQVRRADSGECRSVAVLINPNEPPCVKHGWSHVWSAPPYGPLLHLRMTATTLANICMYCAKYRLIETRTLNPLTKAPNIAAEIRYRPSDAHSERWCNSLIINGDKKARRLAAT